MERRRDDSDRERRSECRGLGWRLMCRTRKEGCGGKSERKERTCSYRSEIKIRRVERRMSLTSDITLDRIAITETLSLHSSDVCTSFTEPSSGAPDMFGK